MPRPHTDPTGRSFLSYCHARMQEARLLVAAQRELGIPTWQDVDDLDEEPMEEELKAVLREPGVANAILYLTPEVAESSVIRQVEAPAILERWSADDAFFSLPVAAGGLSYSKAAELVNDWLGSRDLDTWKIHETREDPLSGDGALRIADRVLRRRLSIVHAALANGEPLKIRLHNRGELGFEPGWALSIDWCRRFENRFAQQGAWPDLLAGLVRVRKALAERAPGRALELSGFCTLSAALALGRTFLSRGPFRCTWRQTAPERPDQRWHLGAKRKAVLLDPKDHGGDLGADGLALLLSVTEDVDSAFGASKRDLPPFRAILRIGPQRSPGEDFRPLWLATPGQAASLVAQTVEAIRAARRKYPSTRTLHLFAAIPAGVAFLLGQSLNTLGPVQTYEIEDVDNVGRYRPELLLRPEDVG